MMKVELIYKDGEVAEWEADWVHGNRRGGLIIQEPGQRLMDAIYRTDFLRPWEDEP